MLQSPLRCHILRLTTHRAVSGEDLTQLHTRCPQLEGLHVEVQGVSVAALTNSAARTAEFNAHAWPSCLRSLGLTLSTSWSSSLVGLQQLINALPSSAGGLHTFKLSPLRATQIDLAPMLQLPHLTCLWPRLPLSSPQRAVVRQLRGLTELDLGGGEGPTKALRLLLSESSHQLQQLQQVNVREVDITIAWAHALMTLPNLTELQPMSIGPRCFPLLRSFTHLRTLCIVPTSDGLSVDEAAVSALLSSLGALSSLISLKVSGRKSLPHVQRMLLDGLAATMTQLQELTLSHFHAVSMLCLRACAHLRSLRIEFSDLHISESVADVLQLVRSLRHLESFHVRECKGTLGAEQRAQLRPPSSLVPSLQEFSWSESMEAMPLHLGRGG
jgi:hypothetical protein